MTKYIYFFIGMIIAYLAITISSKIEMMTIEDITIGDENAWVSFVGSILGALVGGLIAIWVARIQLKKQDQKQIEEERTYLSASTFLKNDSETFKRKEKSRIILTEDYSNMGRKPNEKITFYSIVRVGGNGVIWDCNFNITIGADSNFNETETIKVWLDLMEKDEEILIPLCSRNLDNLKPFVKQIEVDYITDKKERFRFMQSEVDLHRMHYLLDNNEKEVLLLEQNTQHVAWIQN